MKRPIVMTPVDGEMRFETPGDYYRRKAEASRKAWQAYREAEARGADAAELSRLREAAIDAGDCGD